VARNDAGMRVLFISHESTRTGAPLVLLELLRWIKEHTTIEFEVLSLRHGPLDEEFRKVAPLTVLDAGLTGKVMGFAFAVHQVAQRNGELWLRASAKLAGLAKDRAIRAELARASEFDLVYANSAVSSWVFEFLPPDRPPVLTHVHELEFGLRHGLPRRAQEQLVEHSSSYIAAAECVADALTGMGVPRRRIRVHHEFIDGGRQGRSETDYGAPVRQELGIPTDAFVVGSSGTRDWRKGTDLFLQVAARLVREPTRRPIHFVWVGGHSELLDAGALAHDLRRLGLEDRVRFVDSTSVPDRYFSVFDAFALTSREDPFPLVSLEAALWSLPIVSFDSGGASELVEGDDIGRVVPYSDVDAMVATILEIEADDGLHDKLGLAAREKVARYDVSVIAPQIAAVIERSGARPSGAGPAREGDS
jgi:glycosyltransferase involved in cell wall biosynthesis